MTLLSCKQAGRERNKERDRGRRNLLGAMRFSQGYATPAKLPQPVQVSDLNDIICEHVQQL